MNALITISVLAIVSMFLGIFNLRKWILPLVVIGLLAATVFTIGDHGRVSRWYHDMFITDNFSAAFGALMILSTLLFLLIPSNYYKEHATNLEAIYSIVLFSLAGSIIMVSSANLVTFFVGLEILSVSLYLLAGSHKTSAASNEAGMKYFIMGSFASAFLLFGIALVYGATGSLSYSGISAYIINYPGGLPMVLKAGILLVAVGMAFKVAAAPFHFWAPDVYHGSPTVVSVYMITTVKIAGFAAFLRLTQLCFGADTTVWALALAVISALSIIIGNLSALTQTSTKRMLAYSSIAHTGYLLMAIVALEAKTPAYVFLYGTAYAMANLAIFYVLVSLKQTRGHAGFDIFDGLAKKNPLVSACMAIALISLTGIPLWMGFWGKYFVFASAIEHGYLWLVIIAILGSATSIFYYFRPIVNMYMKPEEADITFGKLSICIIVLLTLLMTIGGAFSEWILGIFGN